MIMLAKIINNLTIYPLIRSNNIAVIQFFLYCCFVIFFSPFLYHNCHTNMPQNKQMMSWRYHSRHNLTRIILMEITMVGKVIFNTFNESFILELLRYKKYLIFKLNFAISCFQDRMEARNSCGKNIMGIVY